ncbi:MAG: CcoQ/FixQ family Cbb3-type cytochrome c oxidase assembly chaperone [Bacteroidetes bacterium]|nr:CcoQ/FixQ family Cbb3-type cytochrome c oxidase assembly chaperone [Bacteroidota bacterium]MBU2466635.1 CcoQ/FixQ family Cbb3-type cytochrome c oxidase assembly chaperone [Bacteroidota bacterium]MBU2558854.1 CcoQ/FixQ family Cbb3-type cytochrome c oxidase assembly chaperone [Bacteroidota bacterium]
MKIVTNALENIANIQIFPIIGLIIFLGFFIIMIYRVMQLDPKEVDEISRLPLEDDEIYEHNSTNHQSELTIEKQ